MASRRDLPTSLPAAALWYAGRGIPVFPLRPRSKAPAIPRGQGGKGFRDATTDQETIKTWWQEYPNANMGAEPPGGLCVDVDDPLGLDELGALDRTLPATAKSRTSRGFQLFYETNGADLRQVNLVRGKIETRVRGHGYAVLPPSVHPSGHVYEWEVPLDRIASAPEWLIEFICAHQGEKVERSPYTCELPEKILPGERHNVLRAWICRWRGQGYRQEEAEILFRSLLARCEQPAFNPFTKAEAQALFRDCWSRYQAGPTPAERHGRTTSGEPDLHDKFITLAELRQHPEQLRAPEAVVPYLAFAGRVTLLAGREKLGKSTLASAAVAALSRGRQFLGASTTEGTAIWLALEEHPYEVDERFDRYRANPERVVIAIRPSDPLSGLERAVEKFKPSLVVVDSLVRLAEGSVTEAGSATQWQPLLSRICNLAHRVGGPAVILVHHARKKDNRYRDSTAVGAACDVIAEMYGRPPHPGIRMVDLRGRFPLTNLAWRLREDGCDVELVGSGDEAQLKDDRLNKAILDWVEKHRGESLSKLQAGVHGRKSDVARAVDQLVKKQRLREGPGKRSARLFWLGE